jgi:hypothetical protein
MKRIMKMSNGDSGQQHPGWMRAYENKKRRRKRGLSGGIGRERTEQSPDCEEEGNKVN